MNVNKPALLIPRFVVCSIVCAAFCGWPSAARAHSASDAYLTLSTEPSAASGKSLIHGQWDIALRDIDFVLNLDENGDGRVTWGEVRAHQAAIERFAYANLRFSGGAGNDCSIKPTRQLVDNHADGAYAALFFEVSCARVPEHLGLEYRLFFAIDPSHRGIFVMRSGADVATSVLSPQNAKIDLKLTKTGPDAMERRAYSHSVRNP